MTETNDVTALAAGMPLWTFGPRRRASAQAPAAVGSRMSPIALSLLLLILLAMMLVARGPITTLLGTADDAAAIGAAGSVFGASSLTKTAPSMTNVARSSGAAPARHIPRDPFGARVDTAGALVPVAALARSGHGATTSAEATSGRSAASAGHSTAAGHSTQRSGGKAPAKAGQCRSSYTVVAGDSLWSIAARQLPHGASAAAVGKAWRQIYSENRVVIGTDPAVLEAGQRLCLG